MSDHSDEQVSVELTPAEIKLVIAALRQFEPYWPADMDDLSRNELLDRIRQSVDHVRAELGRQEPAEQE